LHSGEVLWSTTTPQRLDLIMERAWNDSQPIYRQLRELMVAMILDEVLTEGDPLPSVRNVAAEYRVCFNIYFKCTSLIHCLNCIYNKINENGINFHYITSYNYISI
jgi:DNA-binding transcriptional regulator YhcF (GntR family)